MSCSLLGGCNLPQGNRDTKNLKTFSTAAERFEGAHVLCPGCAHSIIVREMLNATDDNIVASTSTGCLEVCTAIYPYTSWDISWIHIGFENAGAAISGAEAMYKALSRKNRLYNEDRRVKFVAFGGDGGTYDIGFQSLSGALERGHDFIYVCYDNEAYMNTGIQRSSATPKYANTTTQPLVKRVLESPSIRNGFRKLLQLTEFPMLPRQHLLTFRI